MRTVYEISGLCLLLCILSLQLFFSVRRESQTWDEANHIYAGYLSLTRGDFGLNPEHPHLVKLLANLPLLSSQLKVPEPEQRFFKEDAFVHGKEFLYRNDPEQILARTRTAAALLALLTAIVIFFGTREVFGPAAAFVALVLLTFDPNFLAHGAFVTTDVGLSCFMFLSVYMFYRFVKSPSVLRLLATGVIAMRQLKRPREIFFLLCRRLGTSLRKNDLMRHCRRRKPQWPWHLTQFLCNLPWEIFCASWAAPKRLARVTNKP